MVSFEGLSRTMKSPLSRQIKAFESVWSMELMSSGKERVEWLSGRIIFEGFLISNS